MTTTVEHAARLLRRLAPRPVSVAALVLCFATASVVSAMAPAFAVAPYSATTSVLHDHGGAHASHEAPCDHGQDCDCHGTAATAHCCSASAAAAAIWASALPLPSFETPRCADIAGELAVRSAVDPPTPPPRSALI